MENNSFLKNRHFQGECLENNKHIEKSILNKVNDNLVRGEELFADFYNINSFGINIFDLILDNNYQNKIELNLLEIKYLLFNQTKFQPSITTKTTKQHGALMTVLMSNSFHQKLDRESLDYLLKNIDIKKNKTPYNNLLRKLINSNNLLGFEADQIDYIIENFYSPYPGAESQFHAEIIYSLAREYLNGKNIFTDEQIRNIFNKNDLVLKNKKEDKKDKQNYSLLKEELIIWLTKKALNKVDLFLNIWQNKNDIIMALDINKVHSFNQKAKL